MLCMCRGSPDLGEAQLWWKASVPWCWALAKWKKCLKTAQPNLHQYLPPGLIRFDFAEGKMAGNTQPGGCRAKIKRPNAGSLCQSMKIGLLNLFKLQVHDACGVLCPFLLLQKRTKKGARQRITSSLPDRSLVKLLCYCAEGHRFPDAEHG